MRRVVAALGLALILGPLLLVTATALFQDSPPPACKFYAVPVTFTSVVPQPHPRGGNRVGVPDVQFSYALEGRRYTSSTLFCASPANASYEHGRMREFMKQAPGSSDIVAWVPSGDPEAGCISLTPAFGYSRVHEVAPLCRR